MRTLLQTTLFAILAVAWGSTTLGQDRIPWAANLDRARELAAQQNRLVLIHFYADDCAPCFRLERTVFNQPEFIRAVSVNYIPVKINASQAGDLARHYSVDRWPTDVIARPDGSAVFRSVSPPDANQYIAMLDQVAAHERVQMQAPIARATTPNGPNAAGGYGQGGYGPADNQPGYRHASYAPPDTNDAGFGRSPYPPQSSPYGEPPQQANASNSVYRDASEPAPNVQTPPLQPPYRNQHVPSNGYAAPGMSHSPANGPATGTMEPGGNRSVYESPRGAMGGESPNQNYGLQPPANANREFGSGDTGYSRHATQRPADAPHGSTPNDSAPQRNPHIANQSPTEPNQPGQPSPGPQHSQVQGAQAATHPPLALDGQCPVTLVESSRWQKGDPRWGAIHRNRTYLFAGPEQQRRFLAAPDTYSPVLSGYDPVRFLRTGQLVEGRREHGVMYNQIFLFTDEAALEEFWSNPNHYASETRRVMAEADARTAQGPRMQR